MASWGKEVFFFKYICWWCSQRAPYLCIVFIILSLLKWQSSSWKRNPTLFCIACEGTMQLQRALKGHFFSTSHIILQSFSVFLMCLQWALSCIHVSFPCNLEFSWCRIINNSQENCMCIAVSKCSNEKRYQEDLHSNRCRTNIVSSPVIQKWYRLKYYFWGQVLEQRWWKKD